jgi:PEP-CTERM motif-containing protein
MTMLSRKILAATALAVYATGFAGNADAASGRASNSSFFGRADATGAYADAATLTPAGISSPAGPTTASAVDSRDPASGHSFIAMRPAPAAPATVAVPAEAVPEPGTYTFMLAGLGIVAFIALRRHRSRR